jgi:hypothetical protein
MSNTFRQNQTILPGVSTARTSQSNSESCRSGMAGLAGIPSFLR